MWGVMVILLEYFSYFLEKWEYSITSILFKMASNFTNILTSIPSQFYFEAFKSFLFFFFNKKSSIEKNFIGTVSRQKKVSFNISASC